MSENMRNTSLYVIVLIGLVLFCPPAYSERIIIDSEEIFSSAQSYIERGDFKEGLAELEKFVHFFPKNKEMDEALYLIGVCHLEMGLYEKARDTFSRVLMSSKKNELKIRALFMIGESYYQQRIYTEAELYFTRVINSSPSKELKNASLYRLAWTKVQQDKWEEASCFFKRVEKDDNYYPLSQKLAEESLKGKILPQKEPVAGGILAAVLPGLGHAYCYRYRDALIAFLLNGLFIWAAVESFDEDHDALGGILSFLELGWYSGNIYSAVNVTHKHNKRVREDFKKGLEDRVDLHLFTGKDNTAGIAFRVKF